MKKKSFSTAPDMFGEAPNMSGTIQKGYYKEYNRHVFVHLR
jgi:hypothetical protein